MENQDNAIVLAIIGSAGTILLALGANKWGSTFMEWVKEKNRLKSDRASYKHSQIQKLNNRIDELERSVQEERSRLLRTHTILNAMLPLMRIIMKDYPEHVYLLDSLQKEIFEYRTSADGNPENK
jgi:outer membrane murein-binding lipoprotein Lpp